MAKSLPDVGVMKQLKIGHDDSGSSPSKCQAVIFREYLSGVCVCLFVTACTQAVACTCVIPL